MFMFCRARAQDLGFRVWGLRFVAEGLGWSEEVGCYGLVKNINTLGFRVSHWGRHASMLDLQP